MAVRETLSHAENPRLTKAAAAGRWGVGQDGSSRARASGSCVSHCFLHVFSYLLCGLYIERDPGLVPHWASGFYHQFATFFFFFLSEMWSACFHHLLPSLTFPRTPLFIVTYQAAAASSLALTLLLLTEAHNTFRCLKKCPPVLLPTVIETVVSNKEETMERNQFFFK